MLNAVVCDDEPPALELVSELLRSTSEVNIVLASLSIRDAIRRINEGGIDLAVFDIEMPDTHGVSAFDHVSIDPKPLLIFVTAHPEYALDAFSVDAIDYILKPLEPNRVQKAVEKAVRLHALIAGTDGESDEASILSPEYGEAIKVRDAGHVYFVRYDDVRWIEAAGDYSLIHTADREYAMRATIRSLETQLPKNRFVRVHRSAIIASQHVQEVHLLSKGEAQITLTGGATVKASRSYRDVVRALTGPG